MPFANIDRAGSPSPTLEQPWTLPVEAVLSELATAPTGLTESIAAARLRRDGPNEVPQESERRAGHILLAQFSSPLVLLLLAASAVAFGLGDHADTGIIVVMVFIGGILGFFQEYRSERALRSLRRRLTRTAMVIRDGVERRIPATELVRGDLVSLRLGSVVPGDLRLLDVSELALDEAPLTGESLPVSKGTSPVLAIDATPQEQSCMAFLGTHVVQGAGHGIVVGVGAGTELGRTATLLSGRTADTDFQRGVQQFGTFLVRVTFALSAVVFVVLGLVHGNWGEALLFAVALAVGIAPELLPVVVTINLSRGALAMGRRQVLVKRLTAIEDLGNADVICTDKTGTLTLGTLQLAEVLDPDGKASSEPLAWARYCVDVTPDGRATSPFDQVIVDAAAASAVADVLPGARREQLLSFDFERRCMSVVVRGADGASWLITKGATTEVLAACSRRAHTDAAATPLPPAEHARLTDLVASRQDSGERLLAVARRTLPADRPATVADETDLELVGFVAVSDTPKESAAGALAALADVGVRIVVLTGDSERIGRRIAAQIGFAVGDVVSGSSLNAMDEATLRATVEGSNLFARITPAHKLRILKALQANGHTVGFMGDGVNDAPALRVADVGVSFEEAVDVAKEAAAVILLQRDLGVLADGIREGRRTFVNTRTYIHATISSNFGNMLSVAGAALMLPFIPLLPGQILLLNLLSDLPMLSISTDRVAEADVRRPLKWDVPQIANFMYFFGTISSLADYATFALLLYLTRAITLANGVTLFRSGWFLESMLTEVVVIFLVRTRRLSRADPPSVPLTIAATLTVLGTFVLMASPAAAWFGLVPLPLGLVAAILGIVAAYAVVTELGKRVYDRLHEPVPARPRTT